jgi:23S rRNA pseudouridine2605 synthase
MHTHPKDQPISYTWLAMNKPGDTITTRRDPEGRKTVYEFLPHHVGLKVEAVGRLDRATTGLLLFSDDSKLSQALLNPESEIPRTYQVVTNHPLPDHALTALAQGLILADGTLCAPVQAQTAETPAPGRSYRFTLREGKYREVRKIVMHFGCKVRGLHRLSFAGIELEGIKPGTVRNLREDEITRLHRMIKTRNPVAFKTLR